MKQGTVGSNRIEERNVMVPLLNVKNYEPRSIEVTKKKGNIETKRNIEY